MLSEKQIQLRSKAYPNPFQDVLWLTEPETAAVYVLYDAAGRPQLQNTSLPLQTAQLAPGLYFLEVKTADYQYRQSVIKN